jgi:hypothetical protein
VWQSFLSVFPHLLGGTMDTSQTCCHLPGEMLNSAAECADRARIELIRLIFTRCDVVGTCSREYQLSSSSSSSSSYHSLFYDCTIGLFTFVLLLHHRTFSSISSFFIFLSGFNFLQFLDNFLTTWTTF